MEQNNRQRSIDGTRHEPAQQLRMVYRPSGRKPALPKLPPGYSLRTYRAGDLRAYDRLMRNVGFGDWTRKRSAEVSATCLPEGLFFVVHKRSNTIVATAVAQHSPHRDHPNAAQLGWVAADPAHAGKRLGMFASAAALRRILDAGYREIYLLTDDFRLPAIKTYLRLRFRPYVGARGTRRRWRNVCKELGIDYETVDVVER